MKKIVWASTALLTCAACDQLAKLPLPSTPELAIQAVGRQQLGPGQAVTLPLKIMLPDQTGVPYRLTVSSPETETVSIVASTGADGSSSVTIRATAQALPQGLIPLRVSVDYGGQTATTRIPVEIGRRIGLEFARFNAIRAQAGLEPVAFDDEASMNCWLHGRYSVMNSRLEHNENATLPFATPEGQACATTSNLSGSSTPVATFATSTAASDILFSVPFHALGMLRPDQTRVGIGSYATLYSLNKTFARASSGITSTRGGPQPMRPVFFPGDGQTTDLLQYPGAEWPNPLTSCPDFDPKTTGLPIIAATLLTGGTVARQASLTVDGQSMEVCAYGSTQYVNTTDQPGNYAQGPIPAQTMGRDLMEHRGAVFIFPRQPLQPGKTYAVRVTVNGQPFSWSFKTATLTRAVEVGGSVARPD